MKINYKTSMFIVVVVALLVVLACARYLAAENDRMSNELATIQGEFNLISDELNLTNNKLMTIKESLQAETAKSIELSELLKETKLELEISNNTIADLKSEEYKLVYLGDFKITYYCDERFPHICGGSGVTASEKPTEVGVTAAADWSVLPKGSTVYIDGIGWREIQDVGGSVNGKHIDVLVEKHSEALDFGINYEGVWLLVKNNS